MKPDRNLLLTENLISVHEALTKMLNECPKPRKGSLPLLDAEGYILAEDFSTKIDLPSFDHSSMDGFAVRSSDVALSSEETPIKLKIVGDIPAGCIPDAAVNKGEAMRIMTGAVLPQGADAVIPIEMTDHYRSGHEFQRDPNNVTVFSKVALGAYIRKQGEDLLANTKVFVKGTRLRSQEIGFLAMQGVKNVNVFLPPHVAILSTGSELVDLGEKLTHGKIYNSNTFSLGSLVKKNGGTIINLGIAKDTYEDVVNKLNHAIDNQVDMIITSAGVSVGAYDYVRKVIEHNGELSFWRVNMRPGKPLAFGKYLGVPVIGLPGNPVSAFVGFEVFVRPFMRKMIGHQRLERVIHKARIKEPIESDGRESFLRAKVWLEGNSTYAELIDNQSSGNLFSLVKANAFVVVPSGVKFLPSGSEVNTWVFEPIDEYK